MNTPLTSSTQNLGLILAFGSFFPLKNNTNTRAIRLPALGAFPSVDFFAVNLKNPRKRFAKLSDII